MILDDFVVDWVMRELVRDPNPPKKNQKPNPSPATFIVYLVLWRMAFNNIWVAYVSHQKIADSTGLSKSSVQNAIRQLNQRQFIDTIKATDTSTPEHHVKRPWIKSKTLRQKVTPPTPGPVR